ncbi:zinc-dependent alcohol dehydrogenase [Derxia lacustris]|uniref:zinc-dependent alcohol dehydrogenase n=1 Tax=Derxia lacustris TaxID=764842 RepID=UPI000A172D70|nr:zinc-binding alcohol dehydrogenase [Derxia lacustris]
MTQTPITRLQARACWLAEPGRAELREESLAPPADGELTIRTLHSAISRGTEMLVFRGHVPQSEFERMRAPFQAGDFPAPVKYGYCNVGLVEAGPAQWLGRAVFCLYPHQTRYVVPVGAVTPLPEGLAPARAVLAANLETAINALWDAAPRLGDRIAVVGAGVVGLLVAWLAARLPGCEVQLVDIDPARRALAAQLGLDLALPTEARAEADLVIHASGHGDGLATALRLAAFEATVLELSWYGARPVTLALGEAFHARRLQIKSSQVGQVAPAQRARWSYGRRLTLALRLLAEAGAALDPLITDAAPFDQLPEVLARLAGGTSASTLCQRIDYF